MQIGKLIKIQMVKQEINTHDELSKLSGISTQVISRILNSDDGKLSVALILVESLGGELKASFKSGDL